jgi:hypothetical protein
MTDSFDLLTARSFYFEVRAGQLTEIPIVEYIYNFNQHIKSLIKQKADPHNIYAALRIKIFHDDIVEEVDLDDANLQQSILIATQLGFTEHDLICQPNSITIQANTGDSYMFNANVFEQEDEAIYLEFCKLIVEAYDLTYDHIAHLFLPEWLQSSLANSILEIANDAHYGPNMSVIDLNHPRRQEIEELYIK